jgi:hypothetical protein
MLGNDYPETLWQHTAALQEFGIDIAKLTTEGGKELVFNEFGVGGGISPSGDQPARTSEQVRLQ